MSETCLSISKKNRNLPLLIDLFSGCGGLSSGFQAEGFDIAGGLEMVKYAADTASYNLHWRYGEESVHICGDIAEMNPEIFKSRLRGRPSIVVGGPPCQAYSKIGKAKLRSLGKDRVNTNDSRGYLFKEFLRYVSGLKADAVVMENVPEASDFGGMNVPQHVCEVLEKDGYTACWTVLNAADYGVPQTRERAFVLAVKKNIAPRGIFLPEPTHKSPNFDYRTWDNKFRRFSKSKNFRVPPSPSSSERSWVTVGEALSDLPSLFKTSKERYKIYGPNIQMEYKTECQNEYQRAMREWFGRKLNFISGHSFRNTARDFKIFERMSPGEDYRGACRAADEILEEECRAREVCAESNPEKYGDLKKKIVPPYERSKFHTRWKKLRTDIPSHTLVAHLGTDTYSHLHPWEPRGISVREAARLQSFPDGFLFQSPMGESFKQIGNAVPPLLSRAIAKSMAETIGGF